MPIFIKEFCPNCKTLRTYRRCEDTAHTRVGKTEVPYQWVYARCSSCNQIIHIPEFDSISNKNLERARLEAARKDEKNRRKQ